MSKGTYITKRIDPREKYPVMIYLQGENYTKLKDLVEKRKISRFINELVEDKLRIEEQKQKSLLRQKMIKDYQAVARDKKRKVEDEIWDETSEDGLE